MVPVEDVAIRTQEETVVLPESTSYTAPVCNPVRLSAPVIETKEPELVLNAPAGGRIAVVKVPAGSATEFPARSMAVRVYVYIAFGVSPETVPVRSPTPQRRSMTPTSVPPETPEYERVAPEKFVSVRVIPLKSTEVVVAM